MTNDPGQMTRVRVALLLGGDSSEREISFKSGMAMATALSPARFHVTAFDVTARGGGDAATGGKEDTGVAAPDIDAACLSAAEYEALTSWWRGAEADEESHNTTRQRIGWNELPSLAGGRFDVVLSGLHGGWGEDGTVQALLEVAGVPYVGSPQRASVVAIDKQLCKALMRDLDIPAPRGAVIAHPDAWSSFPGPPFFGPCVVKPNAGGSSVAITMLPQGVHDAGWRDAICAALNDGSNALVEEMITGVEVTAAVLGEGRSARVLPLIEIVPQSEGGFYDYEAKYAAGGSQHIIPPRLPQPVQERIAEYARRAHHALGCRGVSRSDYIVTPDGTPYFLEINTLPGMTETSLVPDAARAAGIEFEALMETLVMEALR